MDIIIVSIIVSTTTKNNNNIRSSSTSASSSTSLSWSSPSSSPLKKHPRYGWKQKTPGCKDTQRIPKDFGQVWAKHDQTPYRRGTTVQVTQCPMNSLPALAQRSRSSPGGSVCSTTILNCKWAGESLHKQSKWWKYQIVCHMCSILRGVCVCVYARVIVYIYNMHQAAKIDACLWLKPCEKKNNSYQTTMFLKMSPLTLLVDTPTY